METNLNSQNLAELLNRPNTFISSELMDYYMYLSILQPEMEKEQLRRKRLLNKYKKKITKLRNKIRKHFKTNVAQELISKVWHPERIEKYLEMGVNIEDL